MRSRLNRLPAGRVRTMLAAAAVIVVGAIAIPGRGPTGPGVPVENETIMVAGGPGVPGQVSLDATLYMPNIPGPLPAVIMAHGFGGSKDTIANSAFMSTRGYTVLAYSARGFGHSTGQIALDSLDYEVPDARALVTWLSKRPEVLQALMLAGTDRCVDPPRRYAQPSSAHARPVAANAEASPAAIRSSGRTSTTTAEPLSVPIQSEASSPLMSVCTDRWDGIRAWPVPPI